MREIELVNGKGVALVDDEDYAYLSSFRWYRHSAGYANRTEKQPDGAKLNILIHREIMGDPVGIDVDHRDGNPLNNQRSNLRVATRSQNMVNTKARGGKSRYKGVMRHTYDHAWVAKIGCRGRYYYLGSFQTEEEAALAYNAKALELFGEFARLNEITGVSA